MESRYLGNIKVSSIGMGCMAFSHGYGQIPSRQYAIEAIQQAYKHGCTFFDTRKLMDIVVLKKVKTSLLVPIGEKNNF